jgi:exopolyphosphatase/guanosine-5'-triphosphate,3'-diphosphate pyrophosphatase
VPESVTASGGRIALEFPTGWIDEHPLTHADLDEEAGLLSAAGIKLAAE